MRKGFTLLELLTVVIIVAILAAIAVPQFFKVAERARSAEGTNMLGAVRASLLRYYAENGALTANTADLDVTIGSLKFFNVPVPAAVNYTNGAEIVATIARNATSNPGFGSYQLRIAGDGTISCNANGGICPSGF